MIVHFLGLFQQPVRQRARTAFSLASERAGNNMPARMAMMAMTTKSSIRVNAVPRDPADLRIFVLTIARGSRCGPGPPGHTQPTVAARAKSCFFKLSHQFPKPHPLRVHSTVKNVHPVRERSLTSSPRAEGGILVVGTGLAKVHIGPKKPLESSWAPQTISPKGYLWTTRRPSVSFGPPWAVLELPLALKSLLASCLRFTRSTTPARPAAPPLGETWQSYLQPAALIRSP